ncbi:NAD/NADP-dependent betaine aldehyde dehydrogenase [Streptomyces hirsutus]
MDQIPKGLHVDGEWRPSRSGATVSVEDPGTGTVIAEVADAGPADAVDALDAAVRAQASWAATPPRERGEVLRRAFETIMARKDDLALLMTLEMGKPFAESQAEVAYAAEFLRWFSAEAVRIDGGYMTAPGGPPGGDDASARGSLSAGHPVELPHGDGHSQDRSGARVRAAPSLNRPSRPRCPCWPWWTSCGRPGHPPAW